MGLLDGKAALIPSAANGIAMGIAMRFARERGAVCGAESLGRVGRIGR